MKITFGMIILNGDQVLEEALHSVYPYAHQILIAEGPVGYWQQLTAQSTSKAVGWGQRVASSIKEVSAETLERGRAL